MSTALRQVQWWGGPRDGERCAVPIDRDWTKFEEHGAEVLTYRVPIAHGRIWWNQRELVKRAKFED